MSPVYVSGAGSNYINGQVFAGNQPVTAFEVLLYSQQPDGSFMLEQTASPDSLNIYNFSDVTSGIYLILAIPDPGTIFSAEYLPTYFGNTFMWQSASPVVLGTAQNPYNINLVPFDSIMGGSGRISGGLLAGGKSSVNADQLVLILDQNANPVRYMYTDANGSFAFTGLPFGTYQVYPIIPGLTTQSVVVTLTQTTPSAEVYMTINGQTILGIASQMKTSVIESLYPNPATDAIQVTVSEGGLYDVRIIDDAGRTVVSPYLLNLEKAVPSVVEINSLKKGIYNLVLTSDKGNRSVQRFVKH
jgi:hypothetical protein